MTDGNRLVRTRMPGGVGGAGSIPVPTRFAASVSAGAKKPEIRPLHPTRGETILCKVEDGDPLLVGKNIGSAIDYQIKEQSRLRRRLPQRNTNNPGSQPSDALIRREGENPVS